MARVGTGLKLAGRILGAVYDGNMTNDIDMLSALPATMPIASRAQISPASLKGMASATEMPSNEEIVQSD
jgi:sulfur transfer protein SufE